MWFSLGTSIRASKRSRENAFCDMKWLLDPAPVLYLNDYANFLANGDDTAHKQDREKRLKELLAARVPVQGIGMQSHFGSQPVSERPILRLCKAKCLEMGADSTFEIVLCLEGADYFHGKAFTQTRLL